MAENDKSVNRDERPEQPEQPNQPDQAADWKKPEKPSPAGWQEPPVEEGSSRPVIVESWFTPDEAADVEPPSEPDETAERPATADLPGTEPEQDGGWFTPFDAQLEALLSGAADTIVEAPRPEPSPAKPEQPGDETQPQTAAETQAQPPEAAAPPAAGQPAEPAPAAAEGEAEAAVAPDEDVDTAEFDEVDTAASEPQATRVFAADEAAEQPADQAAAGQPVPEEPEVPAESTPPPDSTPHPTSLSPAEAAFLAEQRARYQPQATGPSAEQPGGPTAEQPQPAETSRDREPPQPQSQEQPSAQPQQPRKPSPYEQVERKVRTLRQRYQSGHITRDQLQNELRNLMILDDEGQWWMLGLESDRWYRYDGQNWTLAEPPDYRREEAAEAEQAPVRESDVRTETGMQEVVEEEQPREGVRQQPHIPLDDEGMPLPAKVPQEDPGATLVSPSTPFMEPMRRSEAPTHPKSEQVEAEEAGHVSRPEKGQELTQPSRAVSEEGDEDQQTIPSERASADRRTTQERAAPAPEQKEAPVQKPKPKVGEFPQPDYSEALGPARNRNTYLKWTIRLSIFGIIGSMALTLCALLGMIGYYFYVIDQYQDEVNTLGEQESFETTKIFDGSGDLLAEFSDPNESRRESVDLAEISPWLIHATISTENETFYTDPGFSVAAIVRAAYQNLQAGGIASGASTITQEVAQAMVLGTEYASERTARRKIDEIIVASEIKRKYSKNEILEIYLNHIFYGNYASGAEAAAKAFFDKSASELNPAEAAFLAGLPQAPAAYNPVINREAAIGRMKTVLRLMAESNDTGCIAIQHDDRTEWGIPNGGELCIRSEANPDGSMTYLYRTSEMPPGEWADLTLDIAIVETKAYRAPEFQIEHPHYVNYVWQQLEREYGPQAVYSAGYRVYTTLDENIQSAAKQAVTEQLAQLQTQNINVNNATVVVLRPTDGAVVAMVGSADYYNEDIDGQVNVALSPQQPGSAIKPFVYLAALEPDTGDYWTPATVIWDVPTDFPSYPPDAPARNYDRRFHGPQTVRSALANSYNIPALKTMQYVGLEEFTSLTKSLGFEYPAGTPLEIYANQPGLPTALGAVEVEPFNLTAAYATLANSGRRVPPYTIITVEDRDGNVIFSADTQPEGLQVVAPEYAYLINSILSDNEARLDAFGSVQWYMRFEDGRPAAVKTGTSNDSRDLWTVGYTPQYAVGVWVGRTDDDPPVQPWQSISGSTGAAPIWKNVMSAAHAGLPQQNFPQPQGITDPIEVCRVSGTRPSAACAGNTYWEVFAVNAPPPPAEQDIFRVMQVDDYTGKLVNEYCPNDVVQRTFLAINDPAAFEWINNTPEGRNWANNMGLTLPVGPPPTEYCSPEDVRPTVDLTYPAENETVKDVIQLRALIDMPGLASFDVRYGLSHNPDAFSGALPLSAGPGQAGATEIVLGTLDTRALTQQYGNGAYTLRLTATDTQGRTVTDDVHIVVQNAEAPAAPVGSPTPAPTFTPLGPAPQPTPTLEPTPAGQ
jgi:membrane peptidoglycan carboxypeptidase